MLKVKNSISPDETLILADYRELSWLKGNDLKKVIKKKSNKKKKLRLMETSIQFTSQKQMQNLY